jgi:hypothetical protein
LNAGPYFATIEAMQTDPVIDYARPGSQPARKRWHVLRTILAVLTVVICLYFCYGAIDSRTFARKWKQYGQNPALIPQIDAAAHDWTVHAAVVCSVAAFGWSAYFIVRWRCRAKWGRS